MQTATWRSEYRTGGGAVHYLEYFVATNFGIGHFKIRSEGKKRPTIECLTEFKTQGWLVREGLNGVIRHIWVRKQRFRAEKAGGRCIPTHYASIEALEEATHLKLIFQNDDKARNVWAALTGTPVGQSFEEIVAKAETQVASDREQVRVAIVEIRSQSDELYGMF